MIAPLDPRSNFSADVELRLLVGGRSLPLSKIGPDHVVLREEGIDLDPCEGEVVLTVDGREHRWSVSLVSGAVPFDRTVQTTPIV